MAGLRTGSMLVTGANRGIGLELVKKILATPRPPAWVFGACRDTEGPRAQELKALASEHSNLVVLQLDVTNRSSIYDALKKVESKLEGSGLNVVVNNAGVVSRATLEDSTNADMKHVYDNNVIGPLLVSQAFHPLLKKAAQECPTAAMTCSKAALINISSSLGSIAQVPDLFETHKLIPYRISKAALNMLTRCQAEAYKKEGILCVSINPGWVKTDMGGMEAPLTKDTSVRGIMQVLSSLTEKDAGTMLDWDGTTLPW
ncbi:C-signal-like isoform X2 [Ambystoma mexicanum]|uniref:C-signal-like isoform X2 n=1 Tax=Ambystoma mexicanum TaxID=8296 RepID=UPI0037E7D360